MIRLLRRLARPPRVEWLHTASPRSNVFGLDRGTPVDRFYIDRFMAQQRGSIRGAVLEVGDDQYSRRFGGGDVMSRDVLHVTGGAGVTLVADLTDVSTLPEGSFDCFICPQTFNFIYDLPSAVAGAHRLLKPGGALLATMAGISQISRFDMDRWGDFWRLTAAAAQRLFSARFGEVTVSCYGNALAATAFLQGLAVEDLPEPALLEEHDPDYQLLVCVVARKTV